MADVYADPRGVTKHGVLRALWHKYGLIVVGNVVFFALLYFIQYRPNSRENRATELLTLAQQQETERRLEAAEVLYRKIVSGYGDCEAAALAQQRLPKVQALAQKKRETLPPLPAACASRIDVRALLENRPSFYLAELVAGYYPEVKQAERERYFAALDGYVDWALNRDNVPLDKLRNSPLFRASELRQRYFSIQAQARFASDWVYDDFKVKNRSLFTLHNVVVELTVTQGSDSERGSVRVAQLAPQAEIDVMEFHIAQDGGFVLVHGTIVADEAKHTWDQRL